MKKRITRLCVFCKEPIHIEAEDNTYVYDKDMLHGYAHKRCFIEKKTSQKRNKWTMEQCNDWLEAVGQKTKSKITQRYLTDWIFKTYDISFLPPYFYNKLASIIDGSNEKVSRPIPVEDILDMWQRKIEYLNKVAARNKDKGKLIEGASRVNYDLSILLSKYDSYLAWKESAEAENKKVLQSIENSKQGINYSTISALPKCTSKANTINISNILDEI